MTLTLRNKYQITLWVTVEEELAIMHLFSSKGWHYINYNAYAVRQHINEGHLSSPIDMTDRSHGTGEIHSSEHYIASPAVDYTQHTEYTTLKSVSEGLAVPLNSQEVSQVTGEYIPPVGVEIVYRDSGEYLNTDRVISDVNGHDTSIDTNTNYARGHEKGVEETQVHHNYEKVSVEPVVYSMNNVTSINEQAIKDPTDTIYSEAKRSDINEQLNVNFQNNSDEPSSYIANKVIIVNEQAFVNSSEVSSYTVIGENAVQTHTQVNKGGIHHESNSVGVNGTKSGEKDMDTSDGNNVGNNERTYTQLQDSNAASNNSMYAALKVDRNNSISIDYYSATKVSDHAGNKEVNNSNGYNTEQDLSVANMNEHSKHDDKDRSSPMENISTKQAEPVIEIVNDEVRNRADTVHNVPDETNVPDEAATETGSIATTRQRRKTAAKAESVIKSVTSTRKKGKSVMQNLKKTQSEGDSVKDKDSPEEKIEIPKPKVKKEIVKNKKSQSEVPILLEEDKKLTEMSLMLVNACDDDPFMCCLCNEQFNDVQQFKDHATEKCLKELFCQKDPPVFKCKDCGQHYWQAFTLVRHRLSQVCQPGKSNKVDGFLTCEHCGKTYPTRRQTDYTLHVMMHHDYKPHVCDVCGKKFMRWTSLRDHKRKHSGERPYKCNYCDLTFTTGSHQRNHELLKHIDVPRRFVCEKCGAAFKFSGGLSTHIKEVHTEEKKFVCNTCGRQFKRRGSLTEHFKTHSDVKDKICNVCGKAFYRRSHLNKHAQRHTNNRKHGCEDCGKRFFTKQSLEVHRRIHSGDKPFACKFCTYKSTSNGNLKKHVLAVHADAKIM